MTSIKIKYRPSSVEGKEGCIYFQIIHNRVVRQLNTDYKVFATEWDAEAESVIVTGNRSSILLGISERLAWDIARLGKVIRQLETEGLARRPVGESQCSDVRRFIILRRLQIV